jgi:hypothetical protein
VYIDGVEIVDGACIADFFLHFPPHPEMIFLKEVRFNSCDNVKKISNEPIRMSIAALGDTAQSL